jgi:hypothetical protein
VVELFVFGSPCHQKGTDDGNDAERTRCLQQPLTNVKLELEPCVLAQHAEAAAEAAAPVPCEQQVEQSFTFDVVTTSPLQRGVLRPLSPHAVLETPGRYLGGLVTRVAAAEPELAEVEASASAPASAPASAAKPSAYDADTDEEQETAERTPPARRTPQWQQQRENAPPSVRHSHRNTSTPPQDVVQKPSQEQRTPGERTGGGGFRRLRRVVDDDSP